MIFPVFWYYSKIVFRPLESFDSAEEKKKKEESSR